MGFFISASLRAQTETWFHSVSERSGQLSVRPPLSADRVGRLALNGEALRRFQPAAIEGIEAQPGRDSPRHDARTAGVATARRLAILRRRRPASLRQQTLGAPDALPGGVGRSGPSLHRWHVCPHQTHARNCGRTRHPCTSGSSRPSARWISAPGGLSRYVLTAIGGLSGVGSPAGWTDGIGSDDFAINLPILP
jgi:hypothetical protein